jgi:D-sedoheptulose 7-phosphate isomerase
MFTSKYLKQSIEIINEIDHNIVEKMAQSMSDIRENGGRIFFIGSGGGAGHASHAVNDFRKIANIESYSPSDNVSELTARINDDGWDSAYSNWLKVSKFSSKDALFVFSVGGGSIDKNISMNLVECLKLAESNGSIVLGVVGKDGGYAKKVGKDNVLVIPVIDEDLITPHTEAFQAVIWHLLVSHPMVLENSMKWESSK